MSTYSSTYEEARERFLAAADEAGFRHLRFRVPHEDASELFLDFALLRRDPKRLLIHFSGVHGIEGYAGSAVQTALLQEELPPGEASLLFVHAVNPYGMKYYRRANGYNVDLNRNFRKGPARPNDDYALFSPYLNPETPNELRWGKALGIWRSLRLGRARSAQAIASGQVSHPRGLFYMGDRVQRELVLLQELLRSHCKEAEKIVAIDLHTGLGRRGQEQLFVDADTDPTLPDYVWQTFGRAADLGDAKTGSYVNQGRFSDAVREVIPQARYVLQEFGTVSPIKTLDALRLENLEWHRRPAEAPRPEPIRRAMMGVFCPDDETWRKNVLHLGCERWRQAAQALER